MMMKIFQSSVVAGFVLAGVPHTSPTSAQTHKEATMTDAVKTESIEAHNKALVEAAFDAWRHGTGSSYDLLADDAAWTIVGRSDAAGTYPSREAFMNAVIRPFNARMRERLEPTIRSIYTDRDTVIVLFDASGTATDGGRYDNTYAWFLEMRDSRIVRAHAFFDSVAFNEFWRRVRPGA